MLKFKNMKWIVLYVFILTITVIYSIPKGQSQATLTQDDKVTITFRHVWTQDHDLPMKSIFQDVIEEFETTHPNVKVNFEGLDQTNHREEKLKSEMVTGNPPDMFVLFGGAELEPYVSSNRLLDLTDFVKEHQLDFIDLSIWTYDNHIYGLPFEGHAQPLFYNKQIFEELDISPPATLDQLNEAIKTLKANGYIPFTLGNSELWPGGIYAHYLMDRYAGPELIEAIAKGNASFLNDNYMKAFTMLQEWSKLNAFNNNFDRILNVNAIQLFNSGEAAMHLNGNWDITLFQATDGSDFQQNVGVIPFPTLKKEEHPSIVGGYTIGIGLSANLTELKKNAALELLQYFYTEEVQRRIVYEAARLPSMNITFDVNRTGPVFEQVVQLLEQSSSQFLAYDNVLSPEVRKAFWTITDQLIKLEITSEEALQQLDIASDAYFNLINNYGGE